MRLQFRESLVKRASVLGASLVVLAVGLSSRYFLTGPIAKYLGVAFWAAFFYLLILLFRPEIKPLSSMAITIAISFIVEFAQLTPGPAWLSSKHILLRYIFGTTFSVLDLPAYVAGAMLGFVIHALLKMGLKTKPTPGHSREE